jgi:hypothetical protein
VTVTISADDPRTIRAIELAAQADHWLKGHNAAGEDVFGVPSQTDPDHYYIVTRSSCDCPDFRSREGRACKHILAVRLHSELVRAQNGAAHPSSARGRGHLTVVD